MEPLENTRDDAHIGGSDVTIGGKFWCLINADDEDDPEEEELLRSSPEVYRRSSLEVLPSPSTRYVKRLKNRENQRRTALLSGLVSTGSRSGSPECRWPAPVQSSPEAKVLKYPVLEPTVFFF
jgi:hypothetical protein